jgi:hypothetical protein
MRTAVAEEQAPMGWHTALSVFLLSFAFANVSGQTPTPDNETAAVLHHMAQQSAEYRKTLPNFTCDENVVSTARHKRKLQLRIEFRATIRVLRQPGGELTENFSITNYMGKPAPETGQLVIPAYVQGGLARGVPSFFVAEKQRCYRYSIKGNRIDYAVQGGGPTCDEIPGTHGFALLDSAGDMLHGETHRPPMEARRHNFTSFSSVDYAPVVLDGKTYRLPSHLYAEIAEGDWLRTFDAHYDSCKLFQATVTIGPASTAPIESPQ